MKRMLVAAFVVLSLVVLSAATVLAGEGRPVWPDITMQASAKSL